MTFRFRQFEIEDDRSTMRVGTDSMLLGSWTDPGESSSILDIGTGCGVLALMMAQKSSATVTAIDVDKDSADQAGSNFKASRWNERLKAVCISLQEFSSSCDGKFDLVITNPPYFGNSLKSPVNARNKARHDDSLSREDLLHCDSNLLETGGKFCLILPAESSVAFIRDSLLHNLHLKRALVISSKPGLPPVRVAMEFMFHPFPDPERREITIRDPDNSYSEEYLELTREFHYGL
jgi:tRNA1Val (adenine37-N6)-methyltransferase